MEAGEGHPSLTDLALLPSCGIRNAFLSVSFHIG